MFFKIKVTNRQAVLIATLTTFLLPVSAQQADLDQRIRRQNLSIDRALKEGSLTVQKASQLRMNLDHIATEISAAKKAGGGSIKPEKLTQIQSELNGTHNLIQASTGAGKKVSASSRALGPKWVPGPDGAQNPKALTREMKQQERQNLRQEDQALRQVQEMQQQEYEKQMLQTLGQQRPQILKNKQDVQRVRQESGAN